MLQAQSHRNEEVKLDGNDDSDDVYDYDDNKHYYDDKDNDAT